MAIKSNFFQKATLIIAILFVTLNVRSYGQTLSNNIVDYNENGTPVNGVKIKTNLPFTTSIEMPTIIIQGYNFGTSQTIGLQIVYYIYGTTPTFFHASISSFGSYTPQVTLANEGGLVVIFINDKPYYQRFTVSAYAKGMTDDVAGYYSGWSVVDQALTGTNQLVLPYQNSFSGNVNMPGTGIWNATGNVGIGTVNPGTFKLAVEGYIHAQQVNVDMNGWSDYVFKKDYQLPTLNEVKTYIDKNRHLPEIPSEQEIVKNGLNLGEIDKLLTKKVEELTLYLIEKDEKEKKQQQQIDLLIKQVTKLSKAKNETK